MAFAERKEESRAGDPGNQTGTSITLRLVPREKRDVVVEVEKEETAAVCALARLLRDEWGQVSDV